MSENAAASARATSWRSAILLRWLKQHQHVTGPRQALDLCQWAYARIRDVARDPERPAIAGGRPVRLVPLPTPRHYTRVELRALRRVLRSQETSFYDGGMVRRFEERFANAFGAKHAIAVSSGTAALHCALAAAGIGPGDEVIVPVFTYVATAFAPMYLGAIPRFVDVDPRALGIDAERIERAITRRTRAIVPVHLCGVPCAMDPVLRIARAHGLAVIEDAAQAHGASYRGRSVGTLGDLGCFSFGPKKSLVTGEGGMILTDDERLARRARLAMSLAERASSGRPAIELDDWEPESEVRYERIGWNYRMGALQAAIGCAQLERFESMRAVRERNARRLRECARDSEALDPQAIPEGALPTYSSCFVQWRDGAGSRERDALAAGLARERIDYHLPPRPLAAHALFGDGARYPGAQQVFERGLALRVDPALGRRAIEDSARALRRNAAAIRAGKWPADRSSR